ncbi:hypothetical protein LOC68_15570 [Blastopirellula sp. JC732]|uniref:Uncharacterized protein n=1 Tax=Blastopirellula sediminis TaxID=2894196 RepID=A0A9X1MME9_9BACT|nr:hypothetical protein [Blastopirellula sediminis]MCC9606896.1 hypothetical protein [Blastopirellula sediminis]MCC9629808.1 hypothetical protein [Blastopirellula sediminis]
MKRQPQFHNPFPQLSKVAIIPFNNQSDAPTLNADDVTIAYYGQLQRIRGFEVVPVGVVIRAMEATNNRGRDLEEIRKLGEMLGVDAVIVGSITDYTPYYPKRMTLAVNWYSVNPGFHAIPPGYGLPWGTADEEYIPESHLWEAEFALAKEQLLTQTPDPHPQPSNDPLAAQLEGAPTPEEPQVNGAASIGDPLAAGNSPPEQPQLPTGWPDPRGFVPPPPSPVRPPLLPYNGPIISQIRSYDENDTDFTELAQDHYDFVDDARIGGWQGFLDRSDDFIRFCCYTHITEMLSLRGGAGKSKVALRWQESR